MFNKISFFIFLLLTSNLLSADLKIPNTTIQKGESITIPVSFETEVETLNEFELILNFDSSVLDITNLETGNNFIIKDNPNNFNINFEDIYNAKLSISSQNLELNTDVLFNLSIMGLSSQDSTTQFEIESIRINGFEENVNLIEGLIQVQGLNIKLDTVEALRTNRPNPFSYETIFEFSVEDSTDVVFSVLGMDGRQVLELPGNDYSSYYGIRDISGSLNYFPYTGETLPAGNFELIFRPSSQRLSSGKYIMILRTKNGVYKTNFIYLK